MSGEIGAAISLPPPRQPRGCLANFLSDFDVATVNLLSQPFDAASAIRLPPWPYWAREEAEREAKEQARCLDQARLAEEAR